MKLFVAFECVLFTFFPHGRTVFTGTPYFKLRVPDSRYNFQVVNVSGRSACRSDDMYIVIAYTSCRSRYERLDIEVYDI